MFSLDLDKLTPDQRAMLALWEEHLKAEFQDKDARASCGTMVANPQFVNFQPDGSVRSGATAIALPCALPSSPWQSWQF